MSGRKREPIPVSVVWRVILSLSDVLQIQSLWHSQKLLYSSRSLCVILTSTSNIISLIYLHLNKLPPIKTILVFSTLHVSQLIADDFGSVNLGINIGMGVTLYPHINPTVSNIVMKVHCKCSIERTLLMMRRNNCHCREMMSH